MVIVFPAKWSSAEAEDAANTASAAPNAADFHANVIIEIPNAISRSVNRHTRADRTGMEAQDQPGRSAGIMSRLYQSPRCRANGRKDIANEAARPRRAERDVEQQETDDADAGGKRERLQPALAALD